MSLSGQQSALGIQHQNDARRTKHEERFLTGYFELQRYDDGLRTAFDLERDAHA